MRIVDDDKQRFGVIVDAPEVDPKYPSFRRSSPGVWWQMINGVGESVPAEIGARLERLFLAERKHEPREWPTPQPGSPEPTRDPAILSHEAFLQQYVLNRASSVGNNSLRGADAAGQAQSAWEQIQKQLAQGGK